LMGYGAFRIGSDSSDQLIINYVPSPDYIYLQIRNAIHAEEEQSDR